MPWELLKALWAKPARPEPASGPLKLVDRSPAAVEAKVRELIVATLNNLTVDQVVPEACFEIDIGGSMEVVEVVIACEEEFGIEIPDEDAETLDSVRRLTEYVQRRLGVAPHLDH